MEDQTMRKTMNPADYAEWSGEHDVIRPQATDDRSGAGAQVLEYGAEADDDHMDAFLMADVDDDAFDVEEEDDVDDDDLDDDFDDDDDDDDDDDLDDDFDDEDE